VVIIAQYVFQGDVAPARVEASGYVVLGAVASPARI
jgi:hypothetical protein